MSGYDCQKYKITRRYLKRLNKLESSKVKKYFYFIKSSVSLLKFKKKSLLLGFRTETDGTMTRQR